MTKSKCSRICFPISLNYTRNARRIIDKQNTLFDEWDKLIYSLSISSYVRYDTHTSAKTSYAFFETNRMI